MNSSNLEDSLESAQLVFSLISILWFEQPMFYWHILTYILLTEWAAKKNKPYINKIFHSWYMPKSETSFLQDQFIIVSSEKFRQSSSKWNKKFLTLKISLTSLQSLEYWYIFAESSFLTMYPNYLIKLACMSDWWNENFLHTVST